MKQLTLNFQNDLEPAGEMTTSSLPAGSRSRASRFQQQGNEKVQQITVTSGRKCLESFGRFVPDGSWAKTFSELLIGTEDWFSSRCTLTWKLKGTRYKRLYFQLVASAPRTSDTEHGLLPTVQTQGMKVCENGKTVFAPIWMLPTPTTTDWNTALTPEQAEKYRAKRPNAQALTQLRQMAVDGLLTTPTANDGKNATLPESQKERISLVAEAMKYKTDGQTSQLNPLFVSDMMGFPIMWCDI